MRDPLEQKQLQNIWTLLIIGSLFILMLVMGYVFLQNKHHIGSAVRSEVSSSSIEELKMTLEQVFMSYGISWITQKDSKNRIVAWQVRVPVDLPIPSLHLDIQKAVSRIRAEILVAESDPLTEKVTLQIGWEDSCYFRIQLLPLDDIHRESGRIALVIDDFGDRWDPFIQSFLDLGVDITVSVIPGRKMSSEVTTKMIKGGCEVILHLPMEPFDEPFDNNGYILLADMEHQEMKKIIQRSIDSVPGAVGVNNHMGSKVTSDREAMSYILGEIRSKGLYFLDSRTIATSVAYDMAQSIGLTCGKRDVFIDTENDHDVIRNRIWELAQKAKENGFAIGIGHCQRTTLGVLQEEIPKLQEKGFRFVPLSKVVR